MNEGEDRQHKIRWNSDEKVYILQRAAEITLDEPAMSHLALVRRAQLVLPVARQRDLPSISTPQFAWFRDSLEQAVEVVREERQQLTQAPVVPAPPPDHTHHRPAPDPSPEPSRPAPDPSPEPSRPAPATGLEDAALILLEVAGDLRKQGDALALRMDGLETAVGLCLRGLSDLLAALEGGRLMVSLVRSGAPEAPRPKEPNPAERPVGTHPNPAPSAPTTRRPRVLVLSVDSGGTKGGIKQGTNGYTTALEFWDTPKRHPVSFERFDFILATKWTPEECFQAMQVYLQPGKLRRVSGPATSIADAIKALPEVPV